jgi:tetratricopeptide (TPR) repeat protein
MTITQLRARWWVLLARSRFRREDYVGALSCCRRVLDLDPNHVWALANVGNCLDRQGLYNEAIAFYDRALQNRPDYAYVHARLGLIFRSLRRYQESVDSLNRAFRINPNLRKSAGFVLAFASSVAHIGRIDDAHAAYKEVTEFDLNNPGAFAGLGWSLLSCGKSEEAELPLRTAIRLDPNYADAYDTLGRVLRAIGRDRESLPIWQRLVDLRPDDCEAHASLGWALGGVGRYREAIRTLENVLEKDPTFPVHYSIGLYHLHLKEYQAAIEAEERAISERPDADAYCVIAASLLEQGDPEHAITACNQALDLDPSSYLALHNMGEAFLAMGQPAQAVSCFEKALEVSPATSESRFQLGIAFLKLGKKLEAHNQCRLLRATDNGKADDLQSAISTSE